MEITVEVGIQEQLEALAKLAGLPVDRLVNLILRKEIDSAATSMSALYGTEKASLKNGDSRAKGPTTPAPRGELADRIRIHITSSLVDPARKKGEKEIRIRAGNVHHDLGLRNRLPAVCAVLGSRRFEEVAGVRRVRSSGPANGANAEFLYEL